MTAASTSSTSSTGTTWGPFLHLKEAPNLRDQWKVSVLTVTTGTHAPLFEVTAGQISEALRPRLLAEVNGHCFYRHDITALRSDQERVVKFKLGDLPEASMAIPARGGEVRFAYSSCNGQPYDQPIESDIPSLEPLWKDLVANHKDKPAHVMIGGGDQIYCDPVLKLPCIQKWRKLPEAERFKAPFTGEMKKAVTKYYLERYLEHFSTPHFEEALRSMPWMCSWDDHDTFDGKGSYAEDFENAPVNQGIYAISRQFYQLFQQQLTPDEWNTAGIESAGGLHVLRNFGDVAVLQVDTREERSLDHIVKPESWKRIHAELNAISDDTKHLVVCLGVPIVFPSFALFEKVLELFDAVQQHHVIRRMLGREGKATGLDRVDEDLELRDDMADHWRGQHETERVALIEQLQMLAYHKGLRVTFLSGDVHIATHGELRSVEGRDKKNDPRYMVQLVSSGIGYPPPHSAMKAFDEVENALNEDEPNQWTVGKMVPPDESPEPGETFFLKRNYTVITSAGGQLVSELHTEEAGDDVPTAVHKKVIPALRNGAPLETGQRATCLVL